MSLININYMQVKSLIIGGGAIAFRKANNIINAGGKVTVISPEFVMEFDTIQAIERLELIKDTYKETYIENNTLVICATGDKELNYKIAEHCHKKGLLVNNVSDKTSSSFYNVSSYETSKVEIGVSTKGQSPGISKAIRDRIKAIIDDEIDNYIDEYARKKKVIQESHSNDRQSRLNALSEEYYEKIIGGKEK